MHSRQLWDKDNPPISRKEMEAWQVNPVTRLVLTFFSDFAEQCLRDWTETLHCKTQDLEGWQTELHWKRDTALKVAGLQYNDLMKFYLSPSDFEAYMDEMAEEAGKDDDESYEDEG